LADRLATQRPDDQAAFRRNASALVGQIDSALAEYRPRLDRLSGRKVIVLSPDFSALTGRFGLVEVRPVTEQSPTRLSDVDIAQIRQSARQQGAQCMLIRADVSPQVADDLANRTGLTVLTLDALGTSAGAGSGGGHTRYVDLLKYNLNQLAGVR